MDQESSVIAADIRRIFADVPPPVHQLDRAGLDGYLVEYFRDRRWDGVDITSLRASRGDSSSYLGELKHQAPDWFRYYLPGYMLMVLQDNVPEDEYQINAVIYALMPPESHASGRKESGHECAEAQNSFQGLFSSYTFQQKSAIASFVRHQIAHRGHYAVTCESDMNEDARRSYNSYWHQFNADQPKIMAPPTSSRVEP